MRKFNTNLKLTRIRNKSKLEETRESPAGMSKHQGKTEKSPSLRSFPPAAEIDARVLILGSMPGAESLKRQQYYAHPRNAFWKILGQLLDFAANAPYEERIAALTAKRIAVWDVLAQCERKGSLDADISAPRLNKLAPFLRKHKNLRRIICNGQTAHTLFQRNFGSLAAELGLEVISLPSTSPAHAARTFEEKLQIWRKALADII